MLHDGLDLCQTFDAGQTDGFYSVFVVAVFLIHLYHGIPQSHVFGLVVCSSLTEGNGSGNGIFIAGIGTDQTSVALFHAEHIVTNAGALFF